jgi:hypothetical protein
MCDVCYGLPNCPCCSTEQEWEQQEDMEYEAAEELEDALLELAND